ncbi:DUF2827 domain-containing protein [Methylobacterium sp. J-076]|uniref:DUF2827 domain-containing protein n=1 Tax=Methylobacterium sp. J-076 TaxID=2836655 RepID=UPI001FB98175|nr:DUF2827 domain-containing protein [Methylobacterium sp. J-076]MCJ2013050.1 DUF2827 domain-containing protein [Methylobacterium sp. J-076]
MTKAVKASAGKKGRGHSRLRVGVTLFLRDERQTIWENGIFQNCFFLLQTLKASPLIEWCCVVAAGPGDPAKATQFLASAETDVITMADAMETLDVVIELSAQFDGEWGRAFVARGGRIVAMRVANDFIIDAERMAFKLPPGLLFSGVPYHEVWTLPAFARTCATYYEVGYRAPVRIMQHLWSPLLLERAAAARGGGLSFRYQPGRARWRVAILEPNLCSVKTSHIPLLACEAAYRMRPSLLETVRVFNTDAMRENAVFVRFARALDLIDNGMASFEGRLPIIDIMGPFADAIVSHHWENGQNYLYYEALYGGFPLIHNSALIDGCGYRYTDFDPEDGGRAMLQAFMQHDLNLETYLADGRNLLARLDPTSDANVRLYSEAIAGLFDGDRPAQSPEPVRPLAQAL